jgi:2'-hydroxyisoflavone reductase
MDLLIIGGTQFVGRHLMEVALAGGHRVTLFNRGRTMAALPPGVEYRQGDRRGDLTALQTGQWDAVIDTCGYLPGEVRAMARALAGRIGCYAFVSSVSAYASTLSPNDEDSPLGVLPDDLVGTEVVDGRSYGPLKALCEAALRETVGDASCLLIRPGLVVGPHDPTQRFTWWPARVARALDEGRPMLAPGDPARPLQFIDARDLAAFVLQALARGLRGAFNAIAPPGFTTMGGLLAACGDAAGGVPRTVWAPSAWLLAQGVLPWNQLPLWLPDDGEHAAFMAVDTRRAQDAGLQIRPLATTVADTLAWWQGLPAEARVFSKAGLSAEREAALLAALAG